MSLSQRYQVAQTSTEVREGQLSSRLQLDLIGQDDVKTVVISIQSVLHESDRLIIVGTIGADPDSLATVNVHVPLQGNDDSFSPYALIPASPQLKGPS